MDKSSSENGAEVSPEIEKRIKDLRERIEWLEQKCGNCQGRGWWSDGTGPNYTCSSCNGTGRIKPVKS